jgi:hypothetical protein
MLLAASYTGRTYNRLPGVYVGTPKIPIRSSNWSVPTPGLIRTQALPDP